MKSTTVIASTTRGHRVFLEGVTAAMQGSPESYTVTITDDTIHIQFTPEGKRKVVKSKGGVIDLQSKKVSRWAQGATVAHISVTAAQIIITRD